MPSNSCCEQEETDEGLLVERPYIGKKGRSVGVWKSVDVLSPKQPSQKESDNCCRSRLGDART